MHAVILVAGIASRLRPLTDTTPKCLLKVKGKPILGMMIENLSLSGIENFVFVTGYLEEKIHHFIKDNFPGIKAAFITNEIFASTNNIYSLWLAKEAVKSKDFLLLDGDIVFDRKIIDLLLNGKRHSALALRTNGHVGEEDMKVMTDKDGFVKEINKTMSPADAAGESIGIELFLKDTSTILFDELEVMMEREKKVNVWYEEAFQRIVNLGTKIAAVDVGDLKCMELDTVEDFRSADKI
ncbi:MAG: phosphocholine cytidylyltransferase family protein [Bacteroidetes bacterium]|nr:phosphocholine cytidylyltransferase family protein [Bacteroidota bacterium]